jgi:hypothetical protein
MLLITFLSRRISAGIALAIAILSVIDAGMVVITGDLGSRNRSV